MIDTIECQLVKPYVYNAVRQKHDDILSLDTLRGIVSERERLYKDIDTSTSQLRWNGDCLSVNGIVMRLQPTAFKQLVSLVGIPSTFASKISRELLQYNIDKLLSDLDSKELLVRTIQPTRDSIPTVRAILSDRYEVVNHSRIIENIYSQLSDTMKVNQIYYSDDMLRVSIISDKLTIETNVGDITKAGICFVNGETGLIKLSINWYLYRLWCLNGATSSESQDGFSGKHIGNAVADFNDATDRIIHTLPDILYQWKASTQKQVTLPMFNRVRDQLKLVFGKETLESILDNGLDKSVFDFIQPITKNAQELSQDKRRIAEEIVGQLIRR